MLPGWKSWLAEPLMGWFRLIPCLIELMVLLWKVPLLSLIPFAELSLGIGNCIETIGFWLYNRRYLTTHSVFSLSELIKWSRNLMVPVMIPQSLHSILTAWSTIFWQFF